MPGKSKPHYRRIKQSQVDITRSKLDYKVDKNWSVPHPPMITTQKAELSTEASVTTTEVWN